MGVWIDRYGNQIPIEKLTDRWLMNIIRFLRKQKQEYINALWTRFMFVNENSYAYTDLDIQIERLEQGDIDEFVDIGRELLEEASRRKLKV